MNSPANEHDEYDVVVIGAGAAGGVVAAVLAEAGRRVLLLERGMALAFSDVPQDHLRNHRFARYGHNTGPELDGHPRVVVDSTGIARTVRPHESGYNNNAMTVGGGTRVYGALAWRFLPDDFAMASRYGVPEDSSLVDWPIGYDDLEPFYQRAEWEVGVSGLAGGNRFEGPRRREYPMPPIGDDPQRRLLAAGADRLGWNAFPVPLLINTVAHNGRPACPGCGQCVGFACRADAKNGTQNTMIPRALATGRCTLVTQAFVQRIETNPAGLASGVHWVSDDGPEPSQHFTRARAVVCCASAIESARLLLNSPGDRHPRGLGNDHDQVGRHLQGHYYPTAMGLFDDDASYSACGPGVSIATCQFNHGNPDGIIGGAMLANDFTVLPIAFWRGSLPPGTPAWGIANKRAMREGYGHTIHVKGPVHEIPNPQCRVTLDPTVRDKFGTPVARLSGQAHPQTVRTAVYMRGRAEEWLRASGAKRIWSNPVGLYLSAGQHQAGTCRMGTDPRKSVTDPTARLHTAANVFVSDASLHPTNGGFNPVLTIMAMAFRTAGEVHRAL